MSENMKTQALKKILAQVQENIHSKKESEPVTKAKSKTFDAPADLSLKQSESLKAAQVRILDLEKELYALRENQSSMLLASDVLKEKHEQLLVENAELKKQREEDKQNFKQEKEILIETLERGKKDQARLESLNKILEKKNSESFEDIRANELTLQGKIDIMNLEHRALQREKDNKIISLQKELRVLQNNTSNSERKVRTLNEEIASLKERARKAVSALRVTIHQLESFNYKELEDSVKKDAS